ncbi:MAG: toxin [Actinomycetaceae bacterium]|nr:toxin [Actinomycetaceae bacterium]
MTPKKRRRAIYINEVDRSRLERGIPPSWEEKSDHDDHLTDDGALVDDGDSNDQRLLGEVPPHWSLPQ